jgi:hypothetical protein
MSQVSESWWSESEAGRYLTRLLDSRVIPVIPFERRGAKYWLAVMGTPVDKAVYQECRRRAKAAGKRVVVRPKPKVI